MKPGPRKQTKPETLDPMAEDALPGLQQALEEALTRADGLVERDADPGSERESLARALEHSRQRLARLDEVEQARTEDFRRLRDLLRNDALAGLKAAVEQLQALRSAFAGAESRAFRSERELGVANEQLSEARSRADQLATETERLRAQDEQRAKQVSAFEAALAEARDVKKRIETQLTDALGNATLSAIKLAETRRELEAAIAERDRAASELVAARSDHEQALERAQERERQASGRAESLAVQLADAQREIERLRQEREAANASAEAARQQAEAQVTSISEQHDGFLLSLTEEHEEELAEAERQRLVAERRAAEVSLQLDSVQMQLEVMESERTEARSQTARAEAERDEARQAVRRVEAGRDKAREELGKLEKAEREARSALEEERRKAEQVARELSDALFQNGALMSELDGARQELAKLEKAELEARGVLEEERRRAEALQQQLAEAARSLEALEEERERARVEAAGLSADLETARAELQAARMQRISNAPASSDRRRPSPVPGTVETPSERMLAELERVELDLQNALSERDAAVTDAMRIQRELDDERLARSALESAIPTGAVAEAAPDGAMDLQEGAELEELRLTVDRLERARDDAMHTLAELRVELTQAQSENKKLAAMLGVLDSPQLSLPVQDDASTSAQAATSDAPPARARGSKAPSANRSASSYFVSGEGIPEETVDGRPPRKSRGTDSTSPSTSRRRTRPK